MNNESLSQPNSKSSGNQGVSFVILPNSCSRYDKLEVEQALRVDMKILGTKKQATRVSYV